MQARVEPMGHFVRKCVSYSSWGRIVTELIIDSACVSVWSLRCSPEARMQRFIAPWLAAEHHRLHHVEQWPDSPRKQAVVRAIRSTLESLSRHRRADQEGFSCFLCDARKTNPKVLTMRPSVE